MDLLVLPQVGLLLRVEPLLPAHLLLTLDLLRRASLLVPPLRMPFFFIAPIIDLHIAPRSSTSSPTTSKGAASQLHAQFGLAGALGLIGAALMM